MSSTLSNLTYHIVFSTKYREPLITQDLREELYSYIGGVVRSKRGVLLRVGGVADHLHLVTRLRPDIALSDMMRLVKANSSKWINERESRSGAHFAWQSGYGAFTVSPSQLPALIDYVDHQEDHHRARTFQDEFVAILKKHGVEYDEQYLFDGARSERIQDLAPTWAE
jgi:REP element-mobilizing transposase RayT